MRLAALTPRARVVAGTRGTPPGLALLSFAPPGRPAPHVALKRRAAAAAGVAVHATTLPPDAASADVIAAITATARDDAIDAIFVQYPFPVSVDEAAALDAIPPACDVDVLSVRAFHAFEAGTGPPPATVEAALALLDDHAITVRGTAARVIGAAGPLATAFEIAFARRGARVLPRLLPGEATVAALATTTLVTLLALTPAAVPAAVLPAGAIAIDGGYFNPGGRGDIDTASGTSHLRALVPVPGGLGPMTVAVLLERTVARAEARTAR